MNKLIRLYNKNKKLIIMVIVIIIAVIIGIQLLNYFAKMNNENKSISNNSQNQSLDNGKTYQIIDGDSKDENTYISQKNIIEEFIEMCSNKEYEEAYNMLTEDCKDIQYKSIEEFQKNYVDRLFETPKICSVQAWTGNTYQVKISEDILSTGKKIDDDYIEDYITIVGEKININSYVNSVELAKEQEKANIKIQIRKIYYFMDYAIITLNVQNNRQTPILLDTGEETGQIYLEDQDKIQYKSYSHEVQREDMIIEAQQSKDINLKFEIPYSKHLDIETINFENILSDYNQYNETGYSRIIQMSMDLL